MRPIGYTAPATSTQHLVLDIPRRWKFALVLSAFHGFLLCSGRRGHITTLTLIAIRRLSAVRHAVTVITRTRFAAFNVEDGDEGDPREWTWVNLGDILKLWVTRRWVYCYRMLLDLFVEDSPTHESCFHKRAALHGGSSRR